MATIRKRGDKYQVQIRRKGQSAISQSFTIRKDAETWARQMEVQADRLGLPTDPRALESVTLGELVLRYRDTVSVRKRGAASEVICLTAFLRHPICRKRLSELHTADFADYRDERLKQIKPVTLKRQLSPIHNLFEVARDEWRLPIRDNPLNKLTISTEVGRRERRLTEGEWERLIEAARSRKNPLILPIIILAVETGMRRGEILGIKWDHFASERRSLLIPQTKNGHARTIPLTPAAYALLQSCQRNGDNERVFPISANAFRLSWERIKKRAKIIDLHFHDLRHEGISRFFERGLTMPEVQMISGHRDVRMLLRYAHAQRKIVQAKLDSQSPDTQEELLPGRQEIAPTVIDHFEILDSR